MPDAVRARPRTTELPPLQISLVYDEGRYQSAECQLGSHHGCPGGVRKGTEGQGIVRLPCQCTAEGCTCAGKASRAAAT